MSHRMKALEKMNKISETFSRNSFPVEINKIPSLTSCEENTISMLKRELIEKSKYIKRLEERNGITQDVSNVDDKIKYLKNYLSDKICSINEMKEDLNQKDFEG